MNRYLIYSLYALVLIYFILFFFNIFNYIYNYRDFELSLTHYIFIQTVTFNYTLNQFIGIIIFLVIIVLSLFFTPILKKNDYKENLSVKNNDNNTDKKLINKNTNTSLLDNLISLFKFWIILISILSIITIIVGISKVFDDRNPYEGLILIGSSIVLLVLLGPSALLLVIKEDLREIKKNMEK